MEEMISYPWYLIGALAVGVLTGGLMTHRSQNANEVGLAVIIISLMLVITAPYPTQASWPAYVGLVAAGWIAGALLLNMVSSRLQKRRWRRAQAKIEAQEKTSTEEVEDLWSAM